MASHVCSFSYSLVINNKIWFIIHQILGGIVFILVLVLWARDPGYLQKPRIKFLVSYKL